MLLITIQVWHEIQCIVPNVLKHNFDAVVLTWASNQNSWFCSYSTCKDRMMMHLAFCAGVLVTYPDCCVTCIDLSVSASQYQTSHSSQCNTRVLQTWVQWFFITLLGRLLCYILVFEDLLLFYAVIMISHQCWGMQLRNDINT